MAESIYLGVSVVFPLLFYMGIGALIRKFEWVSENTLSEMNKVVFRIFMAILIFLNAYSVDIYKVFHWENVKLLILSVGGVFTILIVASAVCKKTIADRKRKVIVIQGLYRSNLALYGIPVSIAIYDDGNQGAIAILVAIIVPLYNIIGEIILSNSTEQKVPVRQMIKRVISNPLVIGALSGLVFALGNVDFPQLLMETLEKTSKVATPLAFVIIGGSLGVENLKKDWKDILGVSVVRLIVIPAIVLTVAIWMGMRTYSLVALLGMFASPVAVSSYTMAKERNIAPALAGGLVAVTTLASIFTMFFWIMILNYCSYI